MRNAFVATVMLMSTAGMASAQQVVVAAQKVVTADPKQEVRVTAEDVVVRLMSFDRNHDGKVAMTELSERMQPLVALGDRSRDAALDATEIRALALAPLELVAQVPNAAPAGRYGFGDAIVQSSQSHIENTIDDLRLSPEVSAQAKRIAQAFADEVAKVAHGHLREAVAPFLTVDQFRQFEVDIARVGTTEMFIVTSGAGATKTLEKVGSDPMVLLRPYQLQPEQLKIATAATERFKAEQQLDEARRSALIAQLSDILHEEDCDNLGAALARRPLVKGGGLAF